MSKTTLKSKPRSKQKHTPDQDQVIASQATDEGLDKDPVQNIANHHLNNFDFLRFVAASTVVFHHSYALLGKNDPLVAWSNGYTSLGDIAVCIFFIISGYLIASSFEKNRNPINYVAGRFLRIWPALFAAVILAVFIIGPLNTTFSLSKYFTDPLTWTYFKNLKLIHLQYDLPGVFNNNPYKDAVNGSIWTLPMEVFMYGVTFILGMTRLQKFKSFITLLWVALLVMDMQIFTTPTWKIMPFLWLGAPFIIGKWAIFYLAGTALFLWKGFYRLNGKVALLSLILLAGSCSSSCFRIVSFFALPYLVLYLSFKHLSFLNLSNFGKYGDFSYGIYVYSFPIQQTLVHLLNAHASVNRLFAYSFMGSLIAAIASWHFIEDPALQLKQKLKQKLKMLFPRPQPQAPLPETTL